MVLLAFFIKFRDRVLGGPEEYSCRVSRGEEMDKGTHTQWFCEGKVFWPWGPAPYLKEGPLSLVARGGRPGVWAEPRVSAKVPLISGGYRSLCSCLRKSSALSDPTSSSKTIFSSCVRHEALRGWEARGPEPRPQRRTGLRDAPCCITGARVFLTGWTGEGPATRQP